MSSAATEWTPAQWRACLAAAATGLADLAGAAIEIGDFAINAGRHDAALTARLRCIGGLPGLAGDHWEGVLTLAARPTGVRATLLAFPFADGRRATPAGQVWGMTAATLAPQATDWTGAGWRVPEGGGEWEWVRHPGDCFAQHRLHAEHGDAGDGEVRVLLGDLRPGSGLSVRSAGLVPLAIAVHAMQGMALGSGPSGAGETVIWDQGPRWTESVPPDADAVTVRTMGRVDWPAVGRLVLRVEYLHVEDGHAASALTRALAGVG